MMRRPNRSASLITLLCVMGGVVMWLGCPGGAEAGAKDNIRISGTVVAVNVADHPNTIVLKTLTKSKEELIVGATVHPEVEIMRGSQKITLDSLTIGERVDLVYSKTLEGLVAHSIHVR